MAPVGSRHTTIAVQSSILPPSGLNRFHQGTAPILADSTAQGDLILGSMLLYRAIFTSIRAQACAEATDRGSACSADAAHWEVGLAHRQNPSLVGCQFSKMPGTMKEHNMSMLICKPSRLGELKRPVL